MNYLESRSYGVRKPLPTVRVPYLLSITNCACHKQEHNKPHATCGLSLWDLFIKRRLSQLVFLTKMNTTMIRALWWLNSQWSHTDGMSIELFCKNGHKGTTGSRWKSVWVLYCSIPNGPGVALGHWTWSINQMSNIFILSEQPMGLSLVVSTIKTTSCSLRKKKTKSHSVQLQMKQREDVAIYRFCHHFRWQRW